MDLGTIAKTLSRKGVKIRTRVRTSHCLYCKQLYETRSGKSKYCSPKCKNTNAYLERTDGIYHYVAHIHRKVDGLIGHYGPFDRRLQEISRILSDMQSEIKPGHKRSTVFRYGV